MVAGSRFASRPQLVRKRQGRQGASWSELNQVSTSRASLPFDDTRVTAPRLLRTDQLRTNHGTSSHDHGRTPWSQFRPSPHSRPLLTPSYSLAAELHAFPTPTETTPTTSTSPPDPTAAPALVPEAPPAALDLEQELATVMAGFGSFWGKVRAQVSPMLSSL